MYIFTYIKKIQLNYLFNNEKSQIRYFYKTDKNFFSFK